MFSSGMDPSFWTQLAGQQAQMAQAVPAIAPAGAPQAVATPAVPPQPVAPQPAAPAISPQAAMAPTDRSFMQNLAIGLTGRYNDGGMLQGQDLTNFRLGNAVGGALGAAGAAIGGNTTGGRIAAGAANLAAGNSKAMQTMQQTSHYNASQGLGDTSINASPLSSPSTESEVTELALGDIYNNSLQNMKDLSTYDYLRKLI